MLLLLGLGLAIGTAQEGLVDKLRAETTQVKRWGGVILLIVGAWTIALGVLSEFLADNYPV